MRQTLLAYKKNAFLFVCFCITAFLIHNELTQKYNIRYPVIEKSRSLLFPLKPTGATLTTASDHRHVTYNDVIRNRSLREAKRYTTDVPRPSSDSPFMHWTLNKTQQLGIYIFSAVVLDTSDRVPVMMLNAWEASKSRRTRIKCCFTWSNRRPTFYSSPNRTYDKRFPTGFSAVQIYCPLYGNVSDVTGVAVQFKQDKCLEHSKEMYVKPTVKTKQKNGSLGLCGKIFYGDVDEKLIVDWFEYYRLMKVDKIVLYTHNLTKRAEAVVEYYASTGYLETGPFDIPMKTETRQLGMKNDEAWADEEVVVYDCFERLKGYTYFALVDLDEFILPRNHSDLKAMTEHLRNVYPNTAGFTFRSQLFIKDWGKQAVNNVSDIAQYLTRTNVVLTRRKNLVIVDRILQGTIHTHTFKMKAGYDRTTVNSGIAVINHYRTSCYENYLHHCAKPRRRMDKSIIQFVDKIRSRATAVLKKIS